MALPPCTSRCGTKTSHDPMTLLGGNLIKLMAVVRGSLVSSLPNYAWLLA